MNLSDFGIELTEDQKREIAEKAERKAEGAREVAAVLKANFAGNKRVGVDTLDKFLTEYAERMDTAAKEALA